ncbi:flagellar basal body rod protein FlgB [Cohnella zeiphila]|uniref:Flagellar basal body rod protein FlgB n=1 Tax=Cohnella zeiphila TaxID=2761120 RepID=A0A7X0SMZ1_9BACL|nr:flagellar basal body rod protein FlgB [Cohnella zeiphila]
MDLLSGASFQRLEGALKAASLRQSVLSNNIANVDTPNFKRSDVVFEDLLAQAMGTGNNAQTTSPGGSGAATSIVPQAQVVTEGGTLINNDKNNVDIDKEMSLLAENQLRYNFYAQQVNHDIKMLRIGITGQ